MPIDAHETNDEMMKQWAVAVGKPNSMREGEKKKEKNMKENENPTATKERYLLVAQSGFLQAWFSVAAG